MPFQPLTESRSPTTSRQVRAFTLIELLVSIAIIFVLITAAIVALKKGRAAASRTTTLAALKQMSQAYTGYADAHDGRLLPGYVSQLLLGTAPDKLDLRATYVNKRALLPGDTQSYVWRLAPYLDYAWKTYTADYRSDAMDSRFSNELNGLCFGPASNNNGAKGVGLALGPSFGLNSIYLGGDTNHGLGGTPAFNPWNGPNLQNPNRIAALRMSEIKNPSKMIVFAPTRFHSQTTLAAVQARISDATLGYVELRPPLTTYDPAANGGAGAWSNQQWDIPTSGPTEGQVVGMGAQPAGLLIDRVDESQKVPVCRVDGSVESLLISSLWCSPTTSANGQASVMSQWAPFLP